jgi:hypothetical protein
VWVWQQHYSGPRRQPQADPGSVGSGDVFEAALEAVGQDADEVANPFVSTIDTAVQTAAILAAGSDEVLVVTADQPEASTVLEREDGAQLLTALEEGQSETSFEFGGATESLVALPDGGVGVIGAEGEILAEVLSPWAVDAEGGDVPTWYRIEGTTLVQEIDPQPGAVFPVVADPYVSSQFSWGLWTHVFSKDLTSRMASDPVAVGTILIRFIPTVGPVLAAMSGIIYIAARNAKANNACLILRALVSPGNVYWAGSYKGSRCRAS